MAKERFIPDESTALMALGLSETLCFFKCMEMPEDELKKELGELLDYSMEHPIFLTEPRKWVKVISLARAGQARGIIKNKMTILTCVQQHRLQYPNGIGSESMYEKEAKDNAIRKNEPVSDKEARQEVL